MCTQPVFNEGQQVNQTTLQSSQSQPNNPLSDEWQDPLHAQKLSKAKEGLREIFRQALVLVAVLAWNNVISDGINKIVLGSDRPSKRQRKQALWAKILYAAIITLIVLMIYTASPL